MPFGKGAFAFLDRNCMLCFCSCFCSAMSRLTWHTWPQQHHTTHSIFRHNFRGTFHSTHAQLGQQTAALHLGFKGFNTFEIGLEKPRVKTTLQEDLKKHWKTSSLEKLLAAMAGEWEDWEDWEDWGPPNRYGYYGSNCKNTPSGSGTTQTAKPKGLTSNFPTWPLKSQMLRKASWSRLQLWKRLAKPRQRRWRKKGRRRKKIIKLLHLPPNATTRKKARGGPRCPRLLWRRQLGQLWKRLLLKARSGEGGGQRMGRRTPDIGGRGA